MRLISVMYSCIQFLWILTISLSTGSARLALLMYADANGLVRSPSVYMDWSNIQAATMGVDLYCVDGQKAGGVWIVSGKCCFTFSST